MACSCCEAFENLVSLRPAQSLSGARGCQVKGMQRDLVSLAWQLRETKECNRTRPWQIGLREYAIVLKNWLIERLVRRPRAWQRILKG
jgi:hypothetical protein